MGRTFRNCFASCLAVPLLLLAPDPVLPQSSVNSDAYRLDGPLEECTIGVASARATKDGRPMIWKTRDTDSYDNTVALITSFPIPFLAVIDAGDRQNSWMSMNAHGFSILNSVAYDLSGGSSGLGNGTLMALASGTCATVAQFQHLLDSTNSKGRRTAANFAVMDSTGAAAIFETSGNAYWKFDATDPLTHPKGYALRTNFTFTGGGSTGIQRFNRTNALFQSYSAGDSISPRSILRYQMRDFADPAGVSYPIPYQGTISGAPYGYIPVELTICRISSASASVVQGIRPGEAANKSTFWVILGSPAAGIALPYWIVGAPPLLSTDAPRSALNDTANAIKAKIRGSSPWTSYLKSQLLKNQDGTGLLPRLFATEDTIFASADSLSALWRAGQCGTDALLAAETRYADLAMTSMRAALKALNVTAGIADATGPDGFALAQNYPNPFNPATVLRYTLPVAGSVRLAVYDLLGREVAVLVDETQAPGTYAATFDAAGLSSGVYVYRLTAGSFVQARRMMLVK